MQLIFNIIKVEKIQTQIFLTSFVHMNECKVDVHGSSVIALRKQKLGRTFNFHKIFKTHHVHSQSQKKTFWCCQFFKMYLIWSQYINF